MEQTNILSQFDIQKAEQAARDLTSIEKRHVFIFNEMLDVISKDREQPDYVGNNFDSMVIDEFEDELRRIMGLMHNSGFLMPLAIDALKNKILEGISHSFPYYMTEFRRESLTLLKLNGLICMLVPRDSLNNRPFTGRSS